MRPSLRLAAPIFRSLPVLGTSDLELFRQLAFHPGRPYLFPKGTFADLPAIKQWFEYPASSTSLSSPSLNFSHFEPYATHPVAIEYTSPSESDPSEASFDRGQAPLALILSFLAQATSLVIPPAARLTVAQSPLTDLPRALQSALPPPPSVLRAGRGDIYDASLWLGLAPTATPLHRDPNPNILVQLAGSKRVRLLPPVTGREVWEACVRRAGGAGVEGGEGMMVGAERRELETAIWDSEFDAKSDAKANPEDEAWEAAIDAGDGLFIPNGWWHAVRGVGHGVTASVNWWFR